MKENKFLVFQSIVPYVDIVILLDIDIPVCIDEFQDVACCFPYDGMKSDRNVDFVIKSIHGKDNQFEICSGHNLEYSLTIKCDSGLKKQAVAQIVRMYLGPRFINIDFAGCSVLQTGCRCFKTNLFCGTDISRQLAGWLDLIHIKKQDEILIHIDGRLSLAELQRSLEYVGEKLFMLEKIFVSYNAIPRKNNKEIQMSVLFDEK